MPMAQLSAAITSVRLMHAVTDVYHSRELLWNLTLRELRTKYRRSFLGWAWSMLNPLSQILIYGFVFGTLFNATAPIGDPIGSRQLRAVPAVRLAAVELLLAHHRLGLGAISANCRTGAPGGVSA